MEERSYMRLLRVPMNSTSRPLVLVMVVPLAATCLFATPVGAAGQTSPVRDVVPRVDSTATLQERQRRSIEQGEPGSRLDDPPADARSWQGGDEDHGSDTAATATGTALVSYAQTEAPAFTYRQISTLHSQGTLPARGPPA